MFAARDVVHASALAHLRAFGISAPEDLAVLVSSIAHENPWIREEAARALGTRRTSTHEATAALLKALHDRDWAVRMAAIAALGRLPDPNMRVLVTAALLERVREERVELRAAAIRAVARAAPDDPAVLDVLLSSLSDRVLPVSDAVKHALVDLGLSAASAADGVAALLFADDVNVSWRAAEVLAALTNRGRDMTAPLLAGLASDRREARIAAAAAFRDLDTAPPAVIEALLPRRYDGDEKVRYWTFASLVDLADRQAGRPASCRAPACGLAMSPHEVAGNHVLFTTLIAGLHDPDPAIRWATARRLPALRTGGALATRALCAGLRDEHVTVRQVCAAQLSYVHDFPPDVVSDLLAALDDADPDVRRDVVRAVREIPPPLDPLLVAGLLARLEDPDDEVREEVVDTMAEVRPLDSSMFDAIAAYVHSPASATRGAAMRLLGLLGDGGPAGVRALLSCAQDEDADVRAQVAWALGRARKREGGMGHGVGEALISLLDDPDSAVRLQAVYALGDAPSPDPPLTSALAVQARDPVALVRQAIAEALGRRGETTPETTNALITLLGDEEHRVRRAAAAALDALPDPGSAAVTALTALLADHQSASVRAEVEVAAALARLKGRDEAARDTLLAALGVDDSLARERVIERLGELGSDPTVVAALLRALLDPVLPVQVAAAAALGSVARIDPEVAAQVRARLRYRDLRLQEGAARTLVEQGAFDLSVRLALLSVMRRDGGSALWPLLEQVGVDDGEIAAALLEWLDEQGVDLLAPPDGERDRQGECSAIASVLLRLRDNIESHMRDYALATIACLGATGEELMWAMCPCLQARPVSAGATGVEELDDRIASEEALVAVLQKGLYHWNARVRRAALAALRVGTRSETSISLFLRDLTDRDETTRVHAANALGLLGANDDRALSALRKTLADDEMQVRLAAAAALGKLGAAGDAARRVVLAGLRAQDWWDRAWAAEAVRDGGMVDSRIETTLHTLLSDPKRTVRTAATEALRHMGRDEAER